MLEDTVTATGTLQPKEFVDVGTQVSGQLKKLLVAVGDGVKAAQLLAEIDPSVYQAKVDGDRAQLLNQHAQLADRVAQVELARQQFTRQRNLDRENATTTDCRVERQRRGAGAAGGAAPGGGEPASCAWGRRTQRRRRAGLRHGCARPVR